MKDVPNFRGVYPKDQLPTSIEENESGIVNLENSNKSGSHWVAYYNDKKLKYVLYFDSFGVPPPKELEKYLRTSNKKIQYNTSQIQAFRFTSCGYYSMMFIISMNNGMDYYDFVMQFDPTPTQNNEKIVRKYFSII